MGYITCYSFAGKHVFQLKVIDLLADYPCLIKELTKLITHLRFVR